MIVLVVFPPLSVVGGPMGDGGVVQSLWHAAVHWCLLFGCPSEAGSEEEILAGYIDQFLGTSSPEKSLKTNPAWLVAFVDIHV